MYGQMLQEGTLEHRKELLREFAIDPNAARGTITFYELPAGSLIMMVPEEGVELSWGQAPRNSEIDGGGGREDTTDHS